MRIYSEITSFSNAAVKGLHTLVKLFMVESFIDILLNRMVTNERMHKTDKAFLEVTANAVYRVTASQQAAM